MRRILAIVLPALLLLTACSGSPDAASSSSTASLPSAHAEVFDSVKATPGEAGKAPAVDFDKPLAIEAESIKVLTSGDGDVVKDGQSVVLRQIAVQADDGTALGENFTAAAGQTLIFNADFKSQYPLVYGTFVGAKVGSYVGYATPGSPAVEGSTAAPSQAAQPGTLSVFYIESAKDIAAPLTKPEGDVVTPPAGLPTVKEDDKGVPVITIGDAAAPTALVSQDLIKGKGEALKTSDSIVANYVGVNFVGGEIFDSSFASGKPATFPLTGVIKGWTQGLEGKTVGSRVLLVIPKDLAYGDAGSGKASGDLVFVVDILGIQ
ncbi:FKBP-type peptidyl-prolyl cis-trans isomerase [Arthrobacter sp. 35W]|uniref:FKBP-type peptidyl-prolyl cis-trans isomerase n=1 Tax=Arthrobacter sp. 35W TaxID=1132441 RepID=UPI0004167904|nr:FKBP-type peptidyl-prolyl cis-trans isomerase [Arthrobacter sp. 35W]